MFSNDDDSQGLAIGVVFGVIALVIGLVVGVSIYKTNQMNTPAPAATAAAAASDDGASIKIENGVVKFYFATGSAEVAAGAKEALVEVLAQVAAGKKAVISGFHDATGDAAKNEELAKQRAFAVRDALKSFGVADDKLELKKPETLQADGTNAQARRVEVSVQ